MSDSSNSRHSSPLTRKIGVGLTRTSLSPGTRDVTQRRSRDTPLLTPSRIIISGQSLVNSRTSSDRYTSGYNRLGGLKNVSEPNVSSNLMLEDNKTSKNDEDFNQKGGVQPLRKNLSTTNTTQLLNHVRLPGVNVQRSQSDNKGYGYNESILHNRRDKYQIGGETAHTTLGCTSREDNLPSRNVKLSDKITDSEKVENYDLDLEQEEEDVVKDTVDGAVEKTSPNSPSKDSGYHSPRIETNVDSFNTSVMPSSWQSQEPPEPVLKLDSTSMPERPTRSKHSSRKQSHDQSKQPLHLSWQPEVKSSAYDTSASPRVKGESVVNSGVNNGGFEQRQREVDQSGTGSEGTYSKGEEESGHYPVARPRTHRRLTRRSISFKRLEDDEYIGFASLPEQVHRKAVRRGFEFTLMVVGETGLGKSTLINSLFLMDLYKDRKMGNIEERVQKTVELEKKELEIEERGVKLKLTIVDTPGFNDAVNAEESWKPIVNYIDKQFDAYFEAESGLNRKNIQDTRVHCCLYFISPYGHGLRPVDVMVMKKLHHKVNIIPLIAKSDMLTKLEAKRLKERVLQEVQKHNIQIYQYPDCDSDEDEEFKQQDKQLKKSIPFAVVGSNTVVEAGGKKIRGRMYPWGIVEVENPLHSDFIKLRQMLISTHMQDLKDVTCDVHYENFRAEHISQQMTSTHRERGKLKRDSAANLESALATETLLQEKDAEIRKMQEMLAKMQAQLQSNKPRSNGRIGQV